MPAYTPEQIRNAKLRHKEIMTTFQTEAEKVQMRNPRQPYSACYEQALTLHAALYEEMLDLNPIVNGRNRR